MIFFWKETLSWLVFGHLETNFFQTWYDERDHITLHFDASLDDLIFIQGHICMKIKNVYMHFLSNFSVD